VAFVIDHHCLTGRPTGRAITTVGGFGRPHRFGTPDLGLEILKPDIDQPTFPCYRFANIWFARSIAMAQVLVRDLDADVVERLKERARRHRRSLQKEAKAILEDAASRYTMEEAREAADRIRRRLAGRTFSDSVELIREDRER
jgi:plasmid stability protein